MKSFSLVCLFAGAALLPAFGQKAGPFSGRWDLAVTPKVATVKAYPDWMEVGVKDGATAVRIQPRSGSAFYARQVKVAGMHLSLQWENGTTTWDLDVKDGKLTGVEKRGADVFADLAGVRAPLLKRNPPTAWTAAEPIFNGKDLNGWEPTNPALANRWTVKGGELVNEAKGANLQTTRKFDDFKLHIEFNCPEEGNSGIFLRGRYEVQVEYEKVDANDKFHSIGSVYSMLAPSVELPRMPGKWEGFDITLVGRWLTVVRNGVRTIDNQEIAGTTGGALDSNEGEPGPFFIQGDHTGGMKYRNITVQVPKK
ncbi:MAG: DUF1080 domain-containing protein [Candidatus Solibacter sp.]|nr:DUF1080 domain-containing protein [Candidatus Solibacter sp.]